MVVVGTDGGGSVEDDKVNVGDPMVKEVIILVVALLRVEEDGFRPNQRRVVLIVRWWCTVVVVVLEQRQALRSEVDVCVCVLLNHAKDSSCQPIA